MPRIADALERESRTVDLEPGDFDRLLGRRERKQRNRRIGAGVVGVIVALVTAAVLLRTIDAEHHVPADGTLEPTPAPVGVTGALVYALDGNIYLADPDGSNAVKIAARGVPDEGCAGTVGYDRPSWSPDGRYLAFQRFCSTSLSSVPTAAVISEADGSVVAEIQASGFSWSPDSTRIAVWGESQRTLDLYGPDGVRLASLPSPFTGRAAETAPEWSPDGTALLVYSAAPPSLMAVPLDGNPAYELSYGLRIASPDGTRVALQGDRSTVFTDANGAKLSEVDMALRGGVWSPVGNSFASVSRRGDLVLVDATSGKVTVLPEARAELSDGESVNVVQEFSPQGDRILYAGWVRDGSASYNSLFSIGVDGSGAHLLVDGALHGGWRPR